ncbi:outer membrane homotrimeric porin [Fundidesulfovibrio magnetotacticus]|uniref:outer membrane homotrimeric porin n=1 Tax=Fundidesulfovibrio magnetotacticus TaxID=2730080 RepID=UPI001C27940E|nr:outer membrane homotrimeric porin [Fundidesulfovibrio magnetotacticus]
MKSLFAARLPARRLLGPGLFLAVAWASLVLAAQPCRAARVAMSGQFYAYAASYANRLFTPWTTVRAQAQDAFAVWQRLRLRTDFTSDENLGFTFWVQVDNTPWGNATYTVDNPAPAIEVFKAYLQFKWPGTDVEITAGKFSTTLPQSEAFTGSVVLDSEYPAVAVEVPLGEGASLQAAVGRPLGYADALESATGRATDVLDLAWLSLPLTGEGWSFTPWAAAARLARTPAPAPYAGALGGPPDLGYIRRQVLSLGYFEGRGGFAGDAAPYAWAGAALKRGMGDFTLFADLVGGAGAWADAPRNARRGLFADMALEYAGSDRVTPRLFAWWGSGEDADIGNGSERLPTLVRTWNSGLSYLFFTSETIDNETTLVADPTGSWGLGLTLDKIALVEGLSSRLTAAYMRGTSDPAAFRRSVALSGQGYMVEMGRNLTLNEAIVALNFDHSYAVTEQLTLLVETGWARPLGFQASVWGPSMAGAATDSVKVAVGLLYTF